MTNVVIKKGSDLFQKEIEQVNKIWRSAWSDTDTLDPENREEFAEETFFMVYSDKEILSVGRLIPVELEFMDNTYMIEGIADIVSAVKEKGYGKKVMTAMNEYLEKTRETGIGFCSNRNSPFYKKCGFKIAKDKLDNFLYKHKDGRATKSGDPEDEDVVYKEGKDNLMEKVLAHPKEKIFIPIEHW